MFHLPFYLSLWDRWDCGSSVCVWGILEKYRRRSSLVWLQTDFYRFYLIFFLSTFPLHFSIIRSRRMGKGFARIQCVVCCRGISSYVVGYQNLLSYLFYLFWFYCVFQGDLLYCKNWILGVGRGQIGSACCRCRWGSSFSFVLFLCC